MTQKPSYPVGVKAQVTYPVFEVILTIESRDRLTFEIKNGPYARKETVDVEVASLGNNVFAVNWREKDGASIVNIQDFDAMTVLSYAMLPSGEMLRNRGTMRILESVDKISDHSPKRNSRLVLDAMTKLFQRRDAHAVDRFYAEDYIQHNISIPQGRKALREIVSKLKSDVFYEPGMMFAQDDRVAIHGRIRGWGSSPQIVVDMFRIENGKLAEHWDVLQEEISNTEASMFDPSEHSEQS